MGDGNAVGDAYTVCGAGDNVGEGGVRACKPCEAMGKGKAKLANSPTATAASLLGELFLREKEEVS